MPPEPKRGHAQPEPEQVIRSTSKSRLVKAARDIRAARERDCESSDGGGSGRSDSNDIMY
jgi:hypothetical protein